MDWYRRTFLQSLLTWGIGQTGLRWFGQSPQLDRYYQTLAAPTQRKLALLVGIDDYGDRWVLKGCSTDVERQQELLIYRFGFGPSDILTLKGQQATRNGIETAFEEHLLKQARPGDVVLFHFSGYGCQLKGAAEELLRGFVSSDGNVLLEDTLLLLGRSLATEKFTLVLDTSHHPSRAPLQGNLRVRSLPPFTDPPNADELSLQAQIKRRLLEKSSASKTGIVLKAAGDQQIATELSGQGFSAGLFTYALTQYLWQVTPASNVSLALARTTEQVAPLMGEQQQPQQHSSKGGPLFTYYLLPETVQGAEAVITGLDAETIAKVKLTGLPATLIKHYGVNSCFDLPAIGEELPPRLQLRSRTGLTGKVYPLTGTVSLIEGQLLQESIRCLPRNIKLSVALESHLERIERVDATSAFSAVAAVAEVITAGEKEADCLLGRVPVQVSTSEKSVLASQSSQKTDTEGYGLLSAGGILLPNTTGSAEEAIKSAVERLTPTLNLLLAAKLWNLTANEGSSQLAIAATLEVPGESPRPLIQRRTRRLNLPTVPPQPPLNEDTRLAQLPRGCPLQYRLINQSDRPLYFLLLGIDASDQAIIYLPASLDPFIPPGETYTVPAAQDNLSWYASASSGLEQFQAIASSAPFAQTWQTLNLSPQLKRDKARIFPLKNPLELAQSLLQDLHNASAVPAQIVGSSTDSYALDVRTWATLSFVYQVV